MLIKPTDIHKGGIGINKVTVHAGRGHQWCVNREVMFTLCDWQMRAHEVFRSRRFAFCCNLVNVTIVTIVPLDIKDGFFTHVVDADRTEMRRIRDVFTDAHSPSSFPKMKNGGTAGYDASDGWPILACSAESLG